MENAGNGFTDKTEQEGTPQDNHYADKQFPSEVAYSGTCHFQTAQQ